MKKRGIYEILSNEKIAKDVYKMILNGDTSDIKYPGQFINIKIDDLYLRRPISVCDYDDNCITIIFKVVGHGTEKMAEMKVGKKLDILTGLGNGFFTDRSGDNPLLVGGGVGTPPMYRLCKDLINEGKKPVVVLGFNSKEDVFFEEEFKKLGAEVYISTVDGTYGTKGFVTDIIKTLEGYTYHYACGPLPMLKALYNTAEGDGDYSFEERMGCGFGACMGCTVKVRDGFKRVCKDGPVLRKEEIIWE